MMPVEAQAKTLYSVITGRKILCLLVIAPAILGSFLVDIMTGAASLPVSQVVTAIFTPAAVERSVQTIVWTMRLPIALMAIVIGASLGLAGAEMQTILDNPLASPYTLGISAAAGFGAALAIALGVEVMPLAKQLIVPANAFFFAMLCCLLIYFTARIKRASSETLVLVGIALLFLFNALLGLMEYVANPEQAKAIVFWLFGSLMKTTWFTLGVTAAILLVILPMLLADVWKLTALRLGDEKARSLGIEVERLRLKGFILVSLLTATSVAFTGTIGFIGLVAPHIARMLVGEDHRFYIPLSALVGALILSVASILSKVVMPGLIFPIGIITSLTGVPFFVWLTMSRKRKYW
ncbi:MAG: FecCD family ABC transporter permease [Desulfobaccales bacterium]